MSRHSVPDVVEQDENFSDRCSLELDLMDAHCHDQNNPNVILVSLPRLWY
jgi:hypothetical protein